MRIQSYQATRNPADLQNREFESDVNALFRLSYLRPYHIDIVKIGELQLIYTSAKFHFLSNGVKIFRELRKISEQLHSKMGNFFSRTR